MHRESAGKQVVILQVPDGSNLDGLIGALAGAINRHADAVAKPGDSLAQALRESGDGPKLDAIIEMLRSLASVPADVSLIKEELSVIHGLVQELKDSLPKPPGPPAKVGSVKFVFPGLSESE